MDLRISEELTSLASRRFFPFDPIQPEKHHSGFSFTRVENLFFFSFPFLFFFFPAFIKLSHQETCEED